MSASPGTGAEPTPRDAFIRGARELLPFGPGIAAWGLVTGVAMGKSGLSLAEAITMSLLCYAGSAQLAALPLIATLTPISIVLLTCTIVNLRFVVYALTLRPHIPPRVPLLQRLGLGFLVADVMIGRFGALIQREPQYPQRTAYLWGGAACNWIFWQIPSLIGILAADAVPLSWGLELAGTLALVALIVPLCARVSALLGIVVAGLVATLANAWPLRLGLLAAVMVGVCAALAAERVAARVRTRT